jgi:hypothetical protein
MPKAKYSVPATQLGDYYNALNAMKEQELTALAEAHAEDPSRLIRRFFLSIKAVENRPEISRPGIDELFYESSRTDPRSLPTPRGDIKSTIEFASHLCHGRACSVKGAEALDFRYIDREISPARTTKKDARSARRSLDLLLVNAHDLIPVFAELKIRGDKPTYFAFIQVLMLAAELLSPSQRQRLTAHSGGQDFRWPEEGPFADIYIIAFDPPQTGKYRERSYKATKKISERLVKDPSFSGYIRRIAYLEATSTKDGTMEFEKHFAFGRGT